VNDRIVANSVKITPQRRQDLDIGRNYVRKAIKAAKSNETIAGRDRGPGMISPVRAHSKFAPTSFATTMAGVIAAASLAACATVKIEAPDKPIEINLNVKIEQEVRVKLDREIEDLIESNPDIF